VTPIIVSEVFNATNWSGFKSLNAVAIFAMPVLAYSTPFPNAIIAPATASIVAAVPKAPAMPAPPPTAPFFFIACNLPSTIASLSIPAIFALEAAISFIVLAVSI